MMRCTLRRLLIVACVLLIWQPATGGAGEPDKRNIEVQGHRGARDLLPGNTLAGFRYALETGVDTIELDLALTRDDRFVVIHDLYINGELCLAPGRVRIVEEVAVRSLTLAELKEYDCGVLPALDFPRQQSVPGETIPTLSEVFELLAASDAPAAKTVQLNVELKGVPARTSLMPAPADTARMLLDVLKKNGMLDRVIIQSFDHRNLVELKKLEPGLRISALIGKSLPDLAALATNLGAEAVSPNWEWITAGDVDALHKAGVRVIPWTANTPEAWDYLIQIQADGIITDDPNALIAYLKAKGLR